ncbi:hypothetical protein J4430_00560 [Candidatus Woesearchaeota archaeon]|nr:hypothetical protein [Candidatus Woesearchaeota archaeon]
MATYEEKPERIWVTPPGPGGTKIRHIGMIDIAYFYRWLQQWFSFEFTWDPSFEKQYLEKVSSGSKEYQIKWECVMPARFNLKLGIDVNFLFLGVTEAETVISGMKVKLQRGDFELRVDGYVEKNLEGLSFFRKIYQEFIIRERIEEVAQEHYMKVKKFRDDVYAYINQYIRDEDVMI